MRWMFCFRSHCVNNSVFFFWNLFQWCYTACFCLFLFVINIIWDGWSLDVQYKLFSLLSLLQMNQAFDHRNWFVFLLLLFTRIDIQDEPSKCRTDHSWCAQSSSKNKLDASSVFEYIYFWFQNNSKTEELGVCERINIRFYIILNNIFFA